MLRQPLSDGCVTLLWQAVGGRRSTLFGKKGSELGRRPSRAFLTCVKIAPLGPSSKLSKIAVLDGVEPTQDGDQNATVVSLLDLVQQTFFRFTHRLIIPVSDLISQHAFLLKLPLDL